MVKQMRAGFYYSKSRNDEMQYFLDHRNGECGILYFSVSSWDDLWICGVWHPVWLFDDAMASLKIAVARTLITQRAIGQAFLDAFRQGEIKDVASLNSYLGKG